jgi:hypothetical protein
MLKYLDKDGQFYSGVNRYVPGEIAGTLSATARKTQNR